MNIAHRAVLTLAVVGTAALGLAAPGVAKQPAKASAAARHARVAHHHRRAHRRLAHRRLAHRRLAHRRYAHAASWSAPIASISGTTLNWTAISGATSYNVSILPDDPSISKIYKTVSTTSFSLSSLVPGHTYTMGVRVATDGTWSKGVTYMPPSITWPQLEINDMTLCSETMPHGVTYKWAYCPRVNMGNNPGNWQAITAWGQLYECASGNPQPGARVEIRNLEEWIRSKATGQWTRVQSSVGVKGAAWVEDYSNDTHIAADTYQLSDGGTAAVAGGGYNYHFFTTQGRVAINPSDIAGVITTVRARLVDGTYDPTLPKPCYVLSAGADYWKYLDSTWNNFNSNGDVGIGRFKRVDATWRLYTMDTVSSPTTTPLPSPTIDTTAEIR